MTRSSTCIARLAPYLALPLLLALPATATSQHGGPPATSVHVAEVRIETLQERRRVTGELKAVAQSLVATIEPGLVTKLAVDEGDLVKTGDVLAELDRRRLEIAHEQVRAEERVAAAVLAARTAELDMAQRDLAMLQTLDERRASNPKELADAQAEVAIAKARQEESKQSIEVIRSRAALLRTRVDDTTIKAPFDGVVITTHTEEGQWVAEGDGLVEVVAVGSYDVWLDIPQRFAVAVRKQRGPLQIHIDATGESRTTPPATIVPRVDPNARTFPMYVRIEDPEDVLKEGMSVTGFVPTGKQGTFMTMPRDALLRNDAGFFVFVARPGAGGGFSAVPTPIRILFDTDTRVVVESPALSAGDLVVVEGNERLFPMMPISFDAPVATAGGGGT